MVSQAKRKAPSKIVAPRMQGSAKPTTRATINESKTSVSTAENLKATKKQREPETIDISSDAESNDDDIESDEEMAEADQPAAAAEGEDSDADAAAPTFGELVHNQETVDVSAALAGRSTTAATATAGAGAQSRTVAAPSLSSLSTVLTQALRTDDSELLESCLATANQATVRNTIERLDSALAGALLSKLAARIYRRPGRAGSLLQWVQWTLVAHGGALASQPEVMGKLTMLQKVLAERSRGLNSLLVLKGKLDLLESQMQLRKKMQSKESRRDGADDDEENVIWVEGEDDDAARRVAVDDDEDIDEVPTANGVMGDSDEEDDDEDLDDDEDDVDVDDLEEDEDDIDNSDGEDSGEDDESDVEAAPPAKMRKTGGGFTKSR